MEDWTIRAAVPEDEDGLAYLWLRQLCAGQDARAAGLKEAAQKGSAAQVRWWAQHQPIVTALLREAEVRVACDPERSTYTAGAPAVIWAWACWSGDIVYGYGIKRSIVRASRDLACDLTRDLLGSALDEPRRTVLDLVDLYDLEMVPPGWRRERGWASSLRAMSTRVLEGDEVYQAVGRHVLDPSRERWQPGQRRAA